MTDQYIKKINKPTVMQIALRRREQLKHIREVKDVSTRKTSSVNANSKD